MAGSLRCFQIEPHYSPVRANNWDEWLPLAAPFGMRSRLRQAISGVEARPALPRLRCGMRARLRTTFLVEGRPGVISFGM